MEHYLVELDTDPSLPQKDTIFPLESHAQLATH